MAGLKQTYQELVDAIAVKVDNAISDKTLGARKLFRSMPDEFPNYPLITMFNKRLTEVTGSPSHSYREVQVDFGLTGVSLNPAEKEAELTGIALDLIGLFLSDVGLGGKADYAHLVEMVADAPVSQDTPERRWTLVTMAWRFQHTFGF